MRDLKEELDKLIEFANNNENIRAMVLQGSYVNDNAPKDKFSDLDPLFYCEDVNEFIHEFSWRNNFGEVISYFHDEWEMKDNLKGYTRLTIYKDGFKIDFGFQDIKLAKYANDMELYKVYVDKDNIIPSPDVSDESKFYIKKPTNEEFQDILRDFFFDSSYVVKTIYRDEITFNQYMIYILHKKIIQLAIWYVGVKHDFKVNTGIYGRYLKRYLSDNEYRMLKETYPSSDYEEVKKSLIKSFETVRYFGNYIALKLGYNYPQKHDEDMYQYCIEWMK
jgi:aminoglycoside 6-adenylyltransferase